MKIHSISPYLLVVRGHLHIFHKFWGIDSSHDKNDRKILHQTERFLKNQPSNKIKFTFAHPLSGKVSLQTQFLTPWASDWPNKKAVPQKRVGNRSFIWKFLSIFLKSSRRFLLKNYWSFLLCCNSIFWFLFWFEFLRS